MNSLITTDLHLTDGIAEEYRWRIFDRLEELALKYKVSRIYILGDGFDRKDRHTGLLVNKLVDKIIQLRDRAKVVVIILSGNHEKPLSGPYFWEFMKYQKDIFYIIKPTVDLDDVYLLPFSSNPIDDWRDLDFSSSPAIFMHQTVEGALIEGDRKVMSHHILPPLPDIPIFSGDVHRPQICNKIIYIGVPHPVRFGESWGGNRVILIKDGNFKNYLEIPVDSIRRDILEISSSNDLKKLKYKTGDQLRIRYQLSGDSLSTWPVEESKIREWVEKKGVYLASLEAKIVGDGLLQGEGKNESAFEFAKPEDVILQFCKQEELSEDIKKVGLELIKESR